MKMLTHVKRPVSSVATKKETYRESHRHPLLLLLLSLFIGYIGYRALNAHPVGLKAYPTPLDTTGYIGYKTFSNVSYCRQKGKELDRVRVWNQVIGMSLTLPGTRKLFIPCW
jgi:hypothetical protein